MKTANGEEVARPPHSLRRPRVVSLRPTEARTLDVELLPPCDRDTADRAARQSPAASTAARCEGEKTTE